MTGSRVRACVTTPILGTLRLPRNLHQIPGQRSSSGPLPYGARDRPAAAARRCHAGSARTSDASLLASPGPALWMPDDMPAGADDAASADLVSEVAGFRLAEAEQLLPGLAEAVLARVTRDRATPELKKRMQAASSILRASGPLAYARIFRAADSCAWTLASSCSPACRTRSAMPASRHRSAVTSPVGGPLMAGSAR
jgi:hypothetical protein